jgi:hypothetical protein
MPQQNLPPWIEPLQQRDPAFVQWYMSQREHILKDGAIPAKYEHLMTMIVDALRSHLRLAAGALEFLSALSTSASTVRSPAPRAATAKGLGAEPLRALRRLGRRRLRAGRVTARPRRSGARPGSRPGS